MLDDNKFQKLKKPNRETRTCTQLDNHYPTDLKVMNTDEKTRQQENNQKETFVIRGARSISRSVFQTVVHAKGK